MALYADGTITLTTGAVSTTFTVSGLSFQPTWVFLFASGRSTNGMGEETLRRSVGFAVSTSSRRAYVQQSTHAGASSASDKGSHTDCCVAALSAAGASAGKADLDAFLSDGFRLIIDQVFGAALQVGWIAGNETDVQIVDIAEPAATGDQSYATSFALNTGIDDKAVIVIGVTRSGQSNPGVSGEFCIGVMAGNTAVAAVLAGSSQDAQTTMNTYGYCRTGEVLAVAVASGINQRAVPAATPWLSTGFALNWTEVEATFAWTFAALVLKGGRYTVGDALTSTGTSNQTEGTAYTPQALLVLSHGKAASTADTLQAGDEGSIGVATSPTSRRVAFWHDKDAAADADIGIGYREDAIYGNISLDATMVEEGLMDLVSFDSGTPGFTTVMDDADPVAAYFGYLAFGSEGGGDASVTPDVGALTLTGFAPTVQVPRVVTPGVGVLTLDGFAPAAQTPSVARPGAGALALDGFAPSILTPRVVTPEAGELALTGFAPTVGVPTAVLPGVGALTLEGFAPGIAAGSGARPDAGALALTGFEPSVLTPRTVTPELAALQLDGFAPSLLLPRVSVPETGALVFTGLAPEIFSALAIRPETGLLVLTGFAPTVTAAVVVQPGLGVLTLTGFAPSVQLPRVVTPDVGALVLSGFAPSSLTPSVAQPGAGELTLTGFAPNVSIPFSATVGTGALVLTGFAPLALTIEAEPSQTSEPVARSFHHEADDRELTHTATARTRTWTAPRRNQ